MSYSLQSNCLALRITSNMKYAFAIVVLMSDDGQVRADADVGYSLQKT